MVWFLHLPSVSFLLISPPSRHLLSQFLWCCSSHCSAACADSCKMEFTRLMIYERYAMAPQRSHSRTFLLTAVCTQSCMQASGRERNFPDGRLQKQEYSWKNSVNREWNIIQRAWLQCKNWMGSIPGKRCTFGESNKLHNHLWVICLMVGYASLGYFRVQLLAYVRILPCSTERPNTRDGLYIVGYD